MEIRPETHNTRHRLADVVPLPTPYVMFIDPSSVCNFRCKFCPSNNVKEGMQHERMSEETFSNVLKGMAEFPEPVKVVEFYCIGEPLLNPNVPEWIYRLKHDGKMGGGCVRRCV